MTRFGTRTIGMFAVLLSLGCSTDVPLHPTDHFGDMPAPRASAELPDVGVSAASPSSSVREIRLEVGDSYLLEAPLRQYQRFTRYSSSDLGVADVSTTGLIRAVAQGSAIITGVFGGTSFQAHIFVTESEFSEPPSIIGFSITPKFAPALPLEGVRQYAVNVRWSDDRSRPASEVTFSATGGTVSPMGLYTAGKAAGVFAVVARCVCGAVDTAVVTVGSVEAQLSSLTISPKVVTVEPGAIQQFTSSVRWSTGDTTPPPRTYTATGGTVSATGAYKAPTTPGTYRVIVAHTGGTLRDTAMVTVPGTTGGDPSPKPPAPTPPPGDNGSGAAPFFADDFDNGKRNAGGGFKWLSSSNNVEVSTENKYSGSHALRFAYRAKPAGEDATAQQNFDMGRYLPELWLEYMMYVPSNFEHRRDGASNNKLIALYRDKYSDTEKGSWRAIWEMVATKEGTSVGRLSVSLSNRNQIATSGIWPIDDPNRSPPMIGGGGPMIVGQWNRIRLHVKTASSRAVADGQMHLWINDRLVSSTTSAAFHNALPTYPDAVIRRGYLMGWSNSGFSQETVFYLDDVKFFAQNPGW